MEASTRTRPSTDTRERIVVAAAELFRRQGYAGTGMKQIAALAEAPFGSIYHFFPGGKSELGEEVIRRAGTFFAALGTYVVDPEPDLVSGVRAFFDGAAETVRETGYEDACPIAAIALEVASTDPELRAATADVFGDWIEMFALRLRGAGVEAGEAGRLATLLLASLEGGFLLARSRRDERPLETIGTYMAGLVSAAIAPSPPGAVA